jgi:hypothetical protein
MLDLWDDETTIRCEAGRWQARVRDGMTVVW